MSRRGGGRDRRAVGVEPGHGSPGLPLGHPALAPQGPPSPLSQPGVGGGGQRATRSPVGGAAGACGPASSSRRGRETQASPASRHHTAPERGSEMGHRRECACAWGVRV